MDRASALVRVLASGFVTAGAAVVFLWFWPGEGEVTPFHTVVVALSVIVAGAVLVSLWRK